MDNAADNCSNTTYKILTGSARPLHDPFCRSGAVVIWHPVRVSLHVGSLLQVLTPKANDLPTSHSPELDNTNTTGQSSQGIFAGTTDLDDIYICDWAPSQGTRAEPPTPTTISTTGAAHDTASAPIARLQAMPPASSSFTPLNIPHDVVPEWMGSFTLAAPPNTDLWRKPPSRDTSTAPILYTALRSPFIAAEVTVSADWELEWDQGGLVIFAGAPPGQIAAAVVAEAPPSVVDISLDDNDDDDDVNDLDNATRNLTCSSIDTPTSTPSQSPGPSPAQQQQQPISTPPQPPPSTRSRAPPPPYAAPAPASKWVKVGLEFCNNACHATSVVANSDGADWSLSALPPHHERRLDLRVKIERIGYALWVWYEDGVVGWKKLREVTWFFWGVEDKAVRVGVYASRPAHFGASLYERRMMGGGGGGLNAGARNLCVDFEGLEIF